MGGYSVITLIKQHGVNITVTFVSNNVLSYLFIVDTAEEFRKCYLMQRQQDIYIAVFPTHCLL